MQEIIHEKKQEINLLILEDSQAQIEAYEDGIAYFNKMYRTKINSYIFKTYEDCKETLNRPIYDASILDLKLAGNTSEAEGNKIIREIRYKLRFPIIVNTGYKDDLDSDLREQNIFYRVYERDKLDIQSILELIYNLYNTGITRILGGRGEVEQYLTDIFWKHISHSLESWIETPNEKSLLRYILNHIIEYLEVNEEENFEYYFSNEAYIYPPTKGKYFTGDVLKHKPTNKFCVILTPSCDLAHDKASQIAICDIEPFDKGIFNSFKKQFLKGSSTPEQKDKAKLNLGKIVGNNYSNKYYFLPKTSFFAGGIIDFQKVYSFTIKQLEAEFEKITSINSPFTKDIIARFSYYYSRQGSPDFDQSIILSEFIGV